MQRVHTPMTAGKKGKKKSMYLSLLKPSDKITDHPINFRFWSGMYNRFEKGLHPRQSVIDYLMAVKEETQQLEEELAVLGEVISTY